MSAAVTARPDQEAEPIARVRLEASAQMLDFEPGLYSVEVAAPDANRAQEGFVLPCIRLDPLHAAGAGAGRAFVATMTDSAMVMPGAPPAYLRVERGRACVLLTTYKQAGARAGPDVRIRLIGKADAAAAPAQPAAAPTPLASHPLILLAHVERGGDVTAPGGAWVGRPGSGTAMEGFAITPGAGLAAAELEYQAVLGTDWNTPWVAGGAFCGSRGLALPLLGLRIRLTGHAARRFRCQYWASFGGSGQVGPIEDGAVCAAGGAPLEALRVIIVEAPPAPVPVPVSAPVSGPVPAPVKPARPGPRRTAQKP